MSARTPAEIARKNAIAAMMPLLRHYARHGLASVRAPLPAELELPAAEFERRRKATTYEWPLLNCKLDGVSRDELMAGHQSNHITIAYVAEDKLQDVLRAFVAQALTQGIQVSVAGEAFELL